MCSSVPIRTLQLRQRLNSKFNYNYIILIRFDHSNKNHERGCDFDRLSMTSIYLLMGTHAYRHVCSYACMCYTYSYSHKCMHLLAANVAFLLALFLLLECDRDRRTRSGCHTHFTAPILLLLVIFFGTATARTRQGAEGSVPKELVV